MQTKIMNPYALLAQKHRDALDFIAANLPANPTFEQLNEVFLSAITTPQLDAPFANVTAQVFLSGILPFVYTGYVNSKANGSMQYNENQLVIIRQLIQGINTVSVEAIGNIIDTAEETVAASSLSFNEQSPLLMAIFSARTNYRYWLDIIETPGAWTPFLQNDKAFNIFHVAVYVTAAVKGALFAYGFSSTPQVLVNDIFTSFAGAVGLSAGRVALAWSEAV